MRPPPRAHSFGPTRRGTDTVLTLCTQLRSDVNPAIVRPPLPRLLPSRADLGPLSHAGRPGQPRHVAPWRRHVCQRQPLDFPLARAFTFRDLKPLLWFAPPAVICHRAFSTSTDPGWRECVADSCARRVVQREREGGRTARVERRRPRIWRRLGSRRLVSLLACEAPRVMVRSTLIARATDGAAHSPPFLCPWVVVPPPRPHLVSTTTRDRRLTPPTARRAAPRGKQRR